MAFNQPIPDRKRDGKASGAFGTLVQAEKLMQIAFILPCAAFIGWLGGDWLAGRMHQKWPIALGVVFGAAAGLVIVIRMALQAMNDPSTAVQDQNENPSQKGKGNDNTRS